MNKNKIDLTNLEFYFDIPKENCARKAKDTNEIAGITRKNITDTKVPKSTDFL